jgi:hypothetical protein
LCIDLKSIEVRRLNNASPADTFADAVRSSPYKLKNAAPCVNGGNAKAAVRREERVVKGGFGPLASSGNNIAAKH